MEDALETAKKKKKHVFQLQHADAVSVGFSGAYPCARDR